MGKRRGRGSRNRGTWRKSGTQAFEDCGASRKGILRLAARFVIQKRGDTHFCNNKFQISLQVKLLVTFCDQPIDKYHRE